MKNKTLILALICLIGCQGKVFKDKIPALINVKDAEVENTESYDEFGGFGEGYTMEVYQLSLETVQSFIDQPDKKLPTKKSNITWYKKNWNKTPIDTLYNEMFLMALHYSSGNRRLERELEDLGKLLKTSEVYYSLYYKPSGDNPQDVQLFILDTRSRKIYAIEVNI